MVSDGVLVDVVVLAGDGVLEGVRVTVAVGTPV
jgi:hypothetical protein